MRGDILKEIPSGIPPKKFELNFQILKIEILNYEQKPVAGFVFDVIVDGNGMRIESDANGILIVPKPKIEIKLSLVDEKQ